MEKNKGPSKKWLNMMENIQPSHPILKDAVRIRPRKIWNAKPKVAALGVAYPSPPRYVMSGFSPKQYKGRFPPGYLTGPKPHTLDVIGELQFTQYVDLTHNKLADIRYNFMIGGDGVVYEGRGWNRAPDLPMKFKNIRTSSFYISFIGDFRDQPPTKELLRLRDALLDFGVKNHFISPKFLLFQLKAPPFYDSNVDFEKYIDFW